MMKALLTAIAIIASLFGYSQTVTYVDSPEDKRFVMYRDSLAQHLAFIRGINQAKIAIRNAKKNGMDKANKAYGFKAEKGIIIKVWYKRDMKRWRGSSYVGSIEYSTGKTVNYFIINHIEEWRPKQIVLVKEPAETEQQLSSLATNKPGLTIINRLETIYGQTITLDSIKVR